MAELEKSTSSPSVTTPTTPCNDSFGSGSSKPRARSKSLIPEEVDEELMHQISLWLEGLQLLQSKPIPVLSQARIELKFADGCLVAQLVALLYPKLVEIHNYVKGCSLKVKRENWLHLRRKVLSRIDVIVSDSLIEMIIESKPGAIHKVLKQVYDIAMKVEAEKRQVEEEMARDMADTLPLENWRPDTCFLRKDAKGELECMLYGELLVHKDKMTHDVEARDKELTQLRAANEQLRSQVARLHMTVDLKEDRLSELTHQLSMYKRNPALEEKTQNSEEEDNANVHHGHGHGDVHLKPTRRL